VDGADWRRYALVRFGSGSFIFDVAFMADDRDAVGRRPKGVFRPRDYQSPLRRALRGSGRYPDLSALAKHFCAFP
jgi:hypothetical protein